MLKKIITSTLISVIIIGFTGCNGDKPKTLYELEQQVNAEYEQIAKEMDSYPHDKQLKIAKLYGGHILKYMKSPACDIQVAAATDKKHGANGNILKFVKKQCEEMQLLVVKYVHDSSLEYLKKPSEKVQLSLIKSAPNGIGAFLYLKNPTEKAKLAAVKRNASNIQYIKNPSEEVQLIVVKEASWLITYIKNPSEKVQLIAIKKASNSIRNIDNPTEEVQLIAVKEESNLILDIKNPSGQVQLIVVKKDSNLIKYIDNPTEEVQLIAVKKDSKLIKFITNPTIKVQLIAYGKVTIPFNKPNYKISDKNIKLEVLNGKLQITNNTKQFLKVLSLAEYKGNDIFNIPNFSVPPEGVKTVDTTNSADIEIQSLKDKITFGYAIEYQVGNGKTQNLYKTNKYSINDIK